VIGIRLAAVALPSVSSRTPPYVSARWIDAHTGQRANADLVPTYSHARA